MYRNTESFLLDTKVKCDGSFQLYLYIDIYFIYLIIYSYIDSSIVFQSKCEATM